MHARHIVLLALCFIGCRDLTLGPPPPTTAFVAGRVVAAVPGSAVSAPVAGATVAVLNTNVSITTDEKGTFLLGPLPEASYRLFFAGPPGSTTRQRIVSGVRVRPGATNNVGDVSLQENALLTGRALIQGLPSGNIGITVFSPGTDYVTTAADNGGWLLANLPEGSIRATAWRPGFTPATTTDIELQGGVVTSAVDLILEPEAASAPPGSITGSILVLGHDDSAGVTVKATSVQTREVRSTVVTSNNGLFSLSGLTSDLYIVTAELDGYPSARVPNLAVAGGVQLELEPIVMAPPADTNGSSPGTIGGPSGPLFSLDGGVTSSDGGTVMTGDGGTIGAECANDDECASGKLCVSHRCVGCSVNVMCRPGYSCQGGDCVRDCNDNADCALGLACIAGACTGCITSSDCNNAALICNAQSRCAHCQTRAECPAGKACLLSGCGTCTGDGDCGAGSICEQGICTTGNCHGNGDCAADQACVGRQCAACTSDSQCRAGQLCINSSCVVGNCRSVVECAAGQVCLGNQCGSCANDGDCGSGKLCLPTANGLRCTPGTCRLESDCTGASAGMLCTNNVCQTCGSSNPCANGKICNAQGRCVVGDCFTNLDCTGTKAGWACVGGNCRPCATASDCGASGYVCSGGQCLVGNCVDATNCPTPGQLCQSNTCIGCGPTAACPNGQVCDTDQLCHPGNCLTRLDCAADKVCLNRACSSCTADSQCGSGKLCLGGSCVVGNCRLPSDCAVAGQVCAANSCANCTTSAQCGTGQVCDSDGLCHAGNCVSNTDCANSRICLSRSCSNCTLDAQCSSGKICVNGGCVTGTCHSDSDCSGGQQLCETVQSASLWTCKACAPLNAATGTTCGSGRVCDSSGFCHPGACLTNANCTGGQACQNFTCGACTADSQCAGGQLCSGGQCKTGNCHGIGADPNIDCAATNGTCINNVCTGNCRSNADCAQTGYCDVGTHFCAPCTAGGQCSPGKVCTPGSPNTCVAAQCSTIEPNCVLGASCISGACISLGPDTTADGGGFTDPGAVLSLASSQTMALSGSNTLYLSTIENSGPTGPGTYSFALEPNLSVRWRVKDSSNNTFKANFGGAGIVLPAPGYPNGELFLANDGNGGAIAHRSDTGAQVWRITPAGSAYTAGVVLGVPHVAWTQTCLGCNATAWWMRTDGTALRSTTLTGCLAYEAIAFGTKSIDYVCGEQVYLVDPITGTFKTVPHNGNPSLNVGGNFPASVTPIWRAPNNYTVRGVNSGTVTSDVLVYMGRGGGFDWLFAVNVPDDWVTNPTSTNTWTLWANSSYGFASTPLAIDATGAIYFNSQTSLFKVNVFTGAQLSRAPLAGFTGWWNLFNTQLIDVVGNTPNTLQGFVFGDNALVMPAPAWVLPSVPGSYPQAFATAQTTSSNPNNLLVFQNNASGQPVLHALAPGPSAPSFTISPPAWSLGGDSANHLSAPAYECTSDSQCSSTQTCILGRCAGACRDATQCAAGQGCVLAQCGNCTTQSSCRSGEVCWVGQCTACVGAGCCNTTADCASGNYCQGGSCRSLPASGVPGAFSIASTITSTTVGNTSVAPDGTMYVGDLSPTTTKPFWKIISPAGTALGSTPVVNFNMPSGGTPTVMIATNGTAPTLWYGGGQVLHSGPVSSSFGTWTQSTYTVFATQFHRLAQGVSSVLGTARPTIFATGQTGFGTTIIMAIDAQQASAGGAGNPGLLWSASTGTCDPSAISRTFDHLMVGSDGTVYVMCKDGSVEAWAADGDTTTGPAPGRLGLLKWRSGLPLGWGAIFNEGRPAIGKSPVGDILYFPRIANAVGLGVLNLSTAVNGTNPIEVNVDAMGGIVTDALGRAIVLGFGANHEISIVSPTGAVLFDDKVTWYPNNTSAVLTADSQLLFADTVVNGTKTLMSVSVANPTQVVTLFGVNGPANLALDTGSMPVVLSTGQVAGGLIAFDHLPVSGTARTFSGMPFPNSQGPMQNVWNSRMADQQRRGSLKTQ